MLPKSLRDEFREQKNKVLSNEELKEEIKKINKVETKNKKQK